MSSALFVGNAGHCAELMQKKSRARISMPTAMHKIIKTAVLPPRQNADYGVSFEFDDGWIAVYFQLTKEEAERQAARVGESDPVPDRNVRYGPHTRPAKQWLATLGREGKRA